VLCSPKTQLPIFTFAQAPYVTVLRQCNGEVCTTCHSHGLRARCRRPWRGTDPLCKAQAWQLQTTQTHSRIPRGFSKCQEMLAVVVERTLSESVFCIAPGQYAKSKFDWQQETPTQRSAALSTARSLHSGTLPRLDTSGFQMLYHYSARRRGA